MSAEERVDLYQKKVEIGLKTVQALVLYCDELSNETKRELVDYWMNEATEGFMGILDELNKALEEKLS